MKFPTSSLLQVGIPELSSIFSTLNKIKFRICVLTFKVIHALALPNSYILFLISFFHKLSVRNKLEYSFLLNMQRPFPPSLTRTMLLGIFYFQLSSSYFLGSSLKTHKHTHILQNILLYLEEREKHSSLLHLFIYTTLFV